jgi:hypothetical protein
MVFNQNGKVAKCYVLANFLTTALRYRPKGIENGFCGHFPKRPDVKKAIKMAFLEVNIEIAVVFIVLAAIIKVANSQIPSLLSQ